MKNITKISFQQNDDNIYDYLNILSKAQILVVKPFNTKTIQAFQFICLQIVPINL